MKLLFFALVVGLWFHLSAASAFLRSDSLASFEPGVFNNDLASYTASFIRFFSAFSVSSSSEKFVADSEPCSDDTDVCGNEPNPRPIIGILTQPAGNLGPEITPHKPRLTVSTLPNNFDKTVGLEYSKSTVLESNTNHQAPPQLRLEHFYSTQYDEYIAASYVKWLEAAGARVIPVHFNQSKADLLSIFSKLNGLLLPGGGTPLVPKTDFFAAGQVLWEYLNTQDPSFPVFGTCLGFEFLACLFTDTNQSLVDSGDFDAENISWPLTLTSAAYDSRLFKTSLLNTRLEKAVETKNLTYNAHTQGLTPEVFYNTKQLKENFDVLATGHDKNNKKFIAAIESSKDSKFSNIFGVQFHPEKSVFEWFVPSNIPHCRESIELAQNIANSFVDVARKRNVKHSFLDVKEESNKLIENEPRVFLGNFYFSEVFVWKNSTQNKQQQQQQILRV